jgi:glutathione peroxidase
MSQNENTDLYSIQVKNAKGEPVLLNQYKGKAILVVNVASECGFTPQYEGLQKLYEQYQAKGLEILGFPCNQFGGQESGSNDEIQSFCTGRFGVRFPVFAKVDVNGENASPLFQFLKKDGKVLQRFAPIDKPESMTAEIEKALA